MCVYACVCSVSEKCLTKREIQTEVSFSYLSIFTSVTQATDTHSHTPSTETGTDLREVHLPVCACVCCVESIRAIITLIFQQCVCWYKSSKCLERFHGGDLTKTTV